MKRVGQMPLKTMKLTYQVNTHPGLRAWTAFMVMTFEWRMMRWMQRGRKNV